MRRSSGSTGASASTAVCAVTAGSPTETEEDGGRLVFRTNVDDVVAADADHPLRFDRAAAGGLKPYLRVRGDLWALVKRALYYDLVALGETATHEGEAWFGVRSGGQFFPMARADEIDGL